VRGPGGGYRLRPGFKLPPLMFSDDEALAVTFGLLSARQQGIPTDPHAIEGALAKIERVLPESLRSRVQALQAAVSFVSPSGSERPQSKWLLLLSSAVQHAQRVHLCYRSWQDESERDLDPYGIVLHWKNWYVVGWCHLRQNVRVFRVDRIASAELTGDGFQRPHDFNSLEFVLNSFPTAKHGFCVEILIETTLSDAERFIALGTATLEETAGGVLFRAYVERLEWMARTMMSWERAFVIRQPQQELREALRSLAAQALQAAEDEV
jgi:predicted DNA-binding transcriptional regulator YafY